MSGVPESYLAAAEPSWAKKVTDWQLLGLINLRVILSPRVFISDVHLGDNSHIFNSFSNNSKSGLFSQIVLLAQEGVISPLLRDRTIRPQKEGAVFDINSFSDVFQSWRKLDSQLAWINPDITAERQRFFDVLDARLKDAAIVRYSYEDVKQSFMEDVRTAASATSGADWFQQAMRSLSLEQRRQYDRILEREWFSLSDIYEFLQTARVSQIGVTPLLAHGLINEAAYAREVGALFTGFDTEQDATELSVWGEIQSTGSVRTGKISAAELLDQASTVVNGPSLSVLAMLKPNEIGDIRNLGRGYFELAEHGSRTGMRAEEFERQFIHEASEYWGGVCDYIARQHKTVAFRPSKLALFLRQLPGPLSRLGEDAFRFAVSLGQEVSIGESSIVKELISRTGQFIFLTDREEMKTLRQLLPRGAWSKDSLPGIPSTNTNVKAG